MSRNRLGVVAVKVENTRASRGSWLAAPTSPSMTLRHLGGIAALQVLQLVLEAAAGGEADDRRQVEREDARRADLLQAPNTRPITACALSVTAVRSANGFSLTTMNAELLCAPPSSIEKPTIDSTLRRSAGCWCSTFSTRAVTSRVRAHRGGVGQLHADEERALVLFRQEAGGRVQRQREHAAAGKRHEQHRHHGDAHQPAHHRGVAVAHPVDAAQDQPHHAAPAAGVAQEHAAQRRRQRQRVDRRDQHRHADGDGELAEQLAGHAGDEGDRHEHRKQHQR